MKQQYKAEIKKPHKDEASNLFKKEVKFSHHPFQHYLKFMRNVTQSQPKKDGGGTREAIVKDLHKIKGFNVIKLSEKTLINGQRNNEVPDVVLNQIEKKLEPIDASLSDVSIAGIPDFLVFKLPRWHQLSTILPPIKNMKIDEDEETLSIKADYEKPVSRQLVKSLFFVEVKSWKDDLSKSQDNWFERFGDRLDARVFSVKSLNNVNNQYQSINLENPWSEVQ